MKLKHAIGLVLLIALACYAVANITRVSKVTDANVPHVSLARDESVPAVKDEDVLAAADKTAAAASALHTVIDVDRPPMSVNVFFGGTITLTRQGNNPRSFVSVHAYSTDGRGELFIQLPGGPIGTVATLRPLRSGRGVIQIRVTNPAPGQSGFKTIFVNVH